MSLNFSFANSSWVVKNTKWSQIHENVYSDFVKRIYTARRNGDQACSESLRGCLENPLINTFRNLDIAKVGRNSSYYLGQDCGRCPFYLRAYIAYQMELPFSYVKTIAPRGGRDARYGRDGSIVRARQDIKNGYPAWANYGSKKIFFPDIIHVYSGTHRFGPTNNWDEESDFYPVPISRESIIPGLTWYEPNGHVAVVGDVQDSGKVYLFNCHADYTTSAERLSSEDYIRSRTSQGGGFKAWRPYELVNFRTNSRTGELNGGEIVFATNDELRSLELYSTEQYDRPYIWDGQEIPDFLDYLSTKLSGELVHHDPIETIKNGVEETCQALKSRVSSVRSTINANIHLNTIEQSSSQGRLPENIYNTHHWEWEVYSTPSRDVAIRLQFLDLYKKVQLMKQLHQESSPQLDYTGSLRQMILDMKNTYLSEARECEITYQNSNNQAVTLNYLDFFRADYQGNTRLFLMSFDPYHCPERRWGAFTTQELSTCNQGTRKESWYRAQQNLRNQVFRDGERQDMNYSLRELQTLKSDDGNGWDQAPSLNILELLSL